MKYVMAQNQVANITGNINTGTPFDGVYNRTPTEITENFLMYEHTDGLNYINTNFLDMMIFHLYSKFKILIKFKLT
jgi:hypothetical protein